MYGSNNDFNSFPLFRLDMYLKKIYKLLFCARDTKKVIVEQIKKTKSDHEARSTMTTTTISKTVSIDGAKYTNVWLSTDLMNICIDLNKCMNTTENDSLETLSVRNFGYHFISQLTNKCYISKTSAIKFCSLASGRLRLYVINYLQHIKDQHVKDDHLFNNKNFGNEMDPDEFEIWYLKWSRENIQYSGTTYKRFVAQQVHEEYLFYLHELCRELNYKLK